MVYRHMPHGDIEFLGIHHHGRGDRHTGGNPYALFYLHFMSTDAFGGILHQGGSGTSFRLVCRQCYSRSDLKPSRCQSRVSILRSAQRGRVRCYMETLSSGASISPNPSSTSLTRSDTATSASSPSAVIISVVPCTAASRMTDIMLFASTAS